MNAAMRAVRRAGVACVLAVVAASPLAAQAPPPAESLLARHAAAIGGVTSLNKHTSLRLTGTVAVEPSGMKGTIEILRGKPALFLQRIRIEDIGELVKGYDGSVAWVIEMSNPALLTGIDSVVVSTQAEWLHEFLAPAALRGARVDSADFEGQRAWRATYASELGLEISAYFARETGLRIGEVFTTGLGETTNLESDYKDFGGVKLPTTIVNRASGGSVTMTIRDVEFDRLDSAAFALPAAVKALIKSSQRRP